MDEMDEAERPPWWLSKDESGRDDPDIGREAESEQPSWMGMLGSFGSLASELVAASGAREHASHDVPGDHPECIVCRAITTVAVATSATGTAAQPPALPAVRWLPLRRL